jgi:hypothetical protein
MNKLKFSCQKCGCQTGDINLRVPGPHKQGRVLMEQFVCRECFDRHSKALADMFEGCSGADPSKCGMCDCDFGGEGPMFAHRRPIGDGAWVTMAVCSGCFNEYHDCCKGMKK